MRDLHRYARNVVVFLTWSMTSFCCHKSAAVALQLWQYSPFCVIILTLAQAAMLVITLRFRKDIYLNISDNKERRRHHDSIAHTPLVTIIIGHIIAALSTNCSMSLIHASSTFAIKLLEPLTTSLYVYATQGQCPRPLTLCSLVLVIFGAFIFTGNPLQDGVLMTGVIVTLISNMALAIRNTELKKVYRNNFVVTTDFSFGSLLGLVMIPYVVLIILIFAEQTDVILTTMYITVSGLSHVIYTYMSVSMVLKSVSVLTHSVLGIFKRLSVVLLLCVFGHRTLSSVNFIGLLLSAVGLELYAEGTRTSKQGHIFHTDQLVKVRRVFRHQVLFFIFVGVTCFVTIQVHMIDPHNLAALEDQPGFRRSSSTVHQDSNKHTPKIFTANVTQNSMYRSEAAPERKDMFKGKDVISALSDSTRVRTKTTYEGVISESQEVQIRIMSKLLKRFKFVVLADLAVHENKGDAAITVGEFLLMKKLNKKIIFHCMTDECSESKMAAGRDRALELGKENVAVLCHGGGNLISYKEHDTLRARIFTIFHEFERIVLPQSIWVKQGGNLKDTKLVYKHHPNVTLLVRDTYSYDVAQKLFPRNRRFLVPDSAFQIGGVQTYMEPWYDILWLRRQDVESVHYSIPTFKFPSNISVTVTDWRAWHSPKGSDIVENAFHVAQNGFTFLQRGRVIITDRLHGHIMCTLLHIPHVLLDTRDNKLEKYHKTWTGGLEGGPVLTAKNAQDAMDKALLLLDRFKDTRPSLQLADTLI